MTEVPQILRLSKVAKEFNIGLQTIVDFLSMKDHHIEANPNAKITPEMYDLLVKEFQSEKSVKEESRRLGLSFAKKEIITLDGSKPIVREKESESEELLIKDMKSVNNKKVTEKAKSKKTKEKEKKPAKKEKRIEKIEEQQKETVKEKKASKKEVAQIKVVGRIDLDSMNVKTKPAKKTKAEKDKERKAKFPEKKIIPKKEKEPVVTEEKEITQEKKELPDNFIPTEMIKLGSPTILGRMELPAMKELHKKPLADSTGEKKSRKKKRKRIKKDFKVNSTQEVTQDKSRVKEKRTVYKKDHFKPAVSEEEIQKQIKETLARLSGSGKSKASKYRRRKREMISQLTRQEMDRVEEEAKIIKVTEFVTANELASMMNVSVTQIISTCMSLGLFVSINQRMDAETLSIIADEFGYKVEFVSVDVQEAIKEDDDNPEDLTPRHPIVTVMGHVDHGKTSLLDYIRKTNVIAGEAGGITQHIGAYEVLLENGKKITFLDTPGHEAFTAMRARGAKVTDIVIVVVAADENVMPQTIEAINHAAAAGVPIVFAINKIDKPNANPEKIKEQLANLNYLVEDWGGKYQSQEISAKKGVNVEQLMDKVLLEAELLDLKANERKNASGTVIESSLDKGRGYISKVLVQSGTMQIGDMVLVGCTYGRVKAMFNERNLPVKTVGPSTPVLLLGLNGAPQAGDKFNVMDDEHEVKNITTKRLQLQREQGLRTQKHITLDEIGRRIAIGDFKELNLIIKGDMDGSIEALTDALLKQSTMQVQVNVIHKSIGQITESDVLLASASDAIIIGFQVRPSMSARKLAEQEQIDIRLYSIIYNAINELKSAIEGMLAPEIEEKIICNLEIRDVFKITKVGTVAGCMVLDGKITRNTKVRLIRDGIVVYSGELGYLKRFKDDVKEVSVGYECGLNIANFNDIIVGDIIEGYETVEVKRKL